MVPKIRQLCVNRLQLATKAAETEAFVPERKYLDSEPDFVWRNGKPDYTVVNQEYLAGKTRNWAAGSLESLVESVVKTLEMEISHKVRGFVHSSAQGDPTGKQ